MKNGPLYALVVGLLLASLVAGCAPAAAPTAAPVKETVVVKETVQVPAPATEQEWELVVPEGVRKITPIQLAPRLTSLEGKTVALRWNSKHNGDNFLNRIAELFAEKYPTTKVIKVYEVDKSTVKTSGTNEDAARIAKVIAELKPDLVIASQAD